jgi:hypothetical protein
LVDDLTKVGFAMDKEKGKENAKRETTVIQTS